MNRKLCVAAFAAGAVAVSWVAFGYLGSHPLALAMTLLIGAVYVVGAVELRRFDAATVSLVGALEAPPASREAFSAWLAGIHPALHNAVRLRLDGERLALPGPAVTPYLVGLLVMLGMLGTFLGMVVTLNGAVLALETTTDLPTIRAALAAPVKGLGLAFGTSVAGVAASAMLGLISSLCRRERARAGQQLDSCIAGELRSFSRAQRREQAYQALQDQAGALPAVVDKLEAMMARMEQQSLRLDERLANNQEAFHREAKGAYVELAASVDRSLRTSLAEGAKLAGEAIRPAVAETMAGIARETTVLHERVAASVAAQLDALASRFEGTANGVADHWASAASRQAAAGEAQSAQLQQALAGFVAAFEQRSAALVEKLSDEHGALRGDLAAQDEARQQALAASLGAMAQSLHDAQQQQAERDAARLAELTGSVAAMASSLRQEWQQAGEQSLAQQQRICRTLEETAAEISQQAKANAGATIDEVARLMNTAAEAPRVAAEVIGELREQLTRSVARDNDLLEERSRVMETLGTLLDAINHASREQRAAIDALVASSAEMLERIGGQFVAQVGDETARLVDAAAQMTSAGVETASMGEAFGVAVDRFGEANGQMIASLQRIEEALSQSLARSDDQLAYYVAQARELIDLSLLSQKQIVAELQQRLGDAALSEAA